MGSKIIQAQLAAWFVLSCSAVGAFDFQDLRREAQSLAARPYQTETNRIPDSLARLSYVEYRAIQFNQRKALWRDAGLPFQLEYFHPGYSNRQTVSLHEIAGEEVRLIPFQSSLFEYGTNRLDLPADLGFAGFRVVHPVKDFGEVAAFQGASYFRLIGRGQIYGTSARGLALNTTSAEGEEFPLFKQFWIRRPEKSAKEITVFALLDSASMTGAYQFIIRPGTTTVATVKAVLFPRREIKEVGLAPLTSMFLHGKNGRPAFTDFRPEVHDADGLLIQNGRGEWIWHSLETGKMMRVNAFQDENPRGFGLMQRDRDFEHYQDVIAQFERRPSVWVRPLGKWGRGAVQLVQLPSNREFLDNVVVFWIPAARLQPGTPVELEYELHWSHLDPGLGSLGHVRATRVGRVIVEPAQGVPNLRFVVDFDGNAVESLSAKQKLSVKIEYGEDVTLVADSLFKNTTNGTWRLVIEIADPRKAVDLRAFLMRGGEPITEPWTFTWQP